MLSNHPIKAPGSPSRWTKAAARFIKSHFAYRVCFWLWFATAVGAIVMKFPAIGVGLALIGGCLLAYWSFFMGIVLPTRLMDTKDWLCSDAELRQEIAKWGEGG